MLNELFNLSFTKDWRRSADFPTTEANETQVREDMQCLHDEVKNYINEKLIPYFKGKIENCVKQDELPIASADKRGCVRVGAGLKIEDDMLSLNGDDTVHADMAENDNTAATYIENRVCYLDKQQESDENCTFAPLHFIQHTERLPLVPPVDIVSYSTAVTQGTSGRYVPLELGREYEVIISKDIDGEEHLLERYTLKAVKNLADEICLGNELIKEFITETEEGVPKRVLLGSVPIYVKVSSESVEVVVLGEHEDCFIKVRGIEQAGKALPECLLPDTATVAADWNKHFRDKGFISSRPFFDVEKRFYLNNFIPFARWTQFIGYWGIALPKSMYTEPFSPELKYSVSVIGEELADYSGFAQWETFGAGFDNKRLYLGNPHIIDPTKEDTGEELLVIDMRDHYLVFTTTEPNDFADGDLGDGYFVVLFRSAYTKKLDAKYLPYSLTDEIQDLWDAVHALQQGVSS